MKSCNMKPMVLFFALLFLISCGSGGGGIPIPPLPSPGGGSSGTGEGSKITPVTLKPDGSSHAGSVDSFGYSYYSFTTTGGSYVISIGGLSVPKDILSWIIYSDLDFTSPVSGETCNDSYGSGTPGAIACAAPNLPAGTYYLRVYNYGSQPTAYSIAVTPDTSGGYVNTPMQLALETAYDQTISANGYDYYYFVLPAGASGTYKINLTSTNADMGWVLYSDSIYSASLVNCDTSSSPGSESCMTSNLDHGTYYVKVYMSNALPGTYPYTITVTAEGGSEGSPNEPVSLTTGVSYAGKAGPGAGEWINYGYSYYSFTPTQNMAYLISLTSVATGTTWPGVSWNLFSTSDFSTGSLGSCAEVTFAGDLICRTGAYPLSTPSKLTAGTPYYISVQNGTASANTYTITITPFDVSLGCNSGGGTCYNFESGIPADISTTINNLTDAQPSQAPWALFSEPVSIGTGTKGFTSTAPKNNPPSYFSCFKFSATDVKWIGYSEQSTVSSGGAYGYSVSIFLEDASWYQLQSSQGSWDRSVFIPPSGGTHTYEWCYWSSPDTDAALLDDIELHY